MTQQATEHDHENAGAHASNLLGPLLCWAVVFADIGTSVYYTPGILYGTVGKLAGFFIFLTMTVFVLLTLKYAEVTHRFPQGGGVVTVAAEAINRWVGALGGMFILVDYFLTAAISCLSGILYFSVIFPVLGPPFALWITVGVLLLLGILNWVGISESAKVSLVGAIVAFASDLAILVMVFTHISFSYFLSLFPLMFANEKITTVSILFGFAGSFLAFSGLESISQLSPVMKSPRKKVAGLALLLVVLTIGITSPVLTMLSTILQPHDAADATRNAQLISLLGGHWGSVALQTTVAISASALLVFASNTAIIGAYHVFMALSRMEFLPEFILQRNKRRGTPHYSIALATGIPIVVLLVVNGNIDTLGDMYAFGLLGAFTLTCLGLDIVRHRERKAARAAAHSFSDPIAVEPSSNGASAGDMLSDAPITSNHYHTYAGGVTYHEKPGAAASLRTRVKALWRSLDFWLGVLTTILVMVAWGTNLIHKPLATAFGGTIALIGMTVAYVNYNRYARRGRIPVLVTGFTGHLPGSTLAVLTAGSRQNDDVIRTAISQANGHPLVFLYVGGPRSDRTPGMFEVVDPYLDDKQAKDWFGKAAALVKKSKVTAHQFLYRQQYPDIVAHVWQVVRPHDTIVGTDYADKLEDINPDRIRLEVTPRGQVAHMLKRW